MLDVARDIIGTQPILTAFLAIGVGYLVGQINIGDFRLVLAQSCLLALRSVHLARKRKSSGRSG
jgi:putative transport protein